MPSPLLERFAADYETSLDDLRNAIATFESVADAKEFDRIAGIVARIFTYSSRVRTNAERMAQLSEKGLIE